MKIQCPQCRQTLPAAQLNVATDVALCPKCNEAFSLSALVAGGGPDENFDLSQPPPGVWIEDLGRDWRIGATTRSATAFFLVPFLCVWSGFSLGGIYGTQIAAGKFNLFMSLFGIPFLLGTIIFGTIAVLSIAGKVLISSERGAGRLFVGVGPFGWTRRFDWSEVSQVSEELTPTRRGGTNKQIALLGKTSLKFGSMLSDARRYYIIQALRTLRLRETSLELSR